MTRNSQIDSTQQDSLDARDAPLHAENAQLIEPGLEVAPVTEHDMQYINPVHEGDKEAFNQTGKEVVTSQGYHVMLSRVELKPASSEHRKVCGLKRGWFWTLLVVALLLTVLVIGLAVGLSSRGSSGPTQTAPSASPTPDGPSTTPSSDSLEIGGSINPSWYSGSGAWNGSGSALALQNFAEDFDDKIADQVHDKVVYYQHHTGKIQWMRLTANETQPWQQGPPDSEAASDAKNSTPISTVSITWSVSSWHVFYIDSENQVRHRIGNNRSTAWVEGSTRANQLYAWDGDLVGLTACWGTSNDIPIRLFYASSNTTFEEYLWNMKADKWLWQKRWEGYNGAAAVRCLGVSGGNRYVALMNSDNQIEVWYQNKDDNDGSLNWIKSSLLIRGAHPASSLGLTSDVIVWQEASTNLVKVKGIDWQDEATVTTDDLSPGVQYAGVAGTQINVVTFDHGTQIFYQRIGNDLTRLFRNTSMLFGTWEPMEMPV